MIKNEANPIPKDLYELICTWAIKEGNITLWVWTVMQWNLMARSVNIEPLALHNMKLFNDSVQFIYNQNKSDQEGAKTMVKHVYANPTNPHDCSFLSLEIHLCLNAKIFEVT